MCDYVCIDGLAKGIDFFMIETYDWHMLFSAGRWLFGGGGGMEGWGSRRVVFPAVQITMD